jgi:carnosine synthase
MGCVRVDAFEELPGIYSLVRGVVTPEHDGIFRTGNDLLVEEYLDGVEFDVDLVMHRGDCVFSSVSQNWPTAEPSFQEAGLHCPPDHDRKAVGRVVDLCVSTAQAFGLHRGVLHIEAKSTSRGPRIVEVNARMGGGRVSEYVRQVWNVDLIEAHLRESLDLPPALTPSRKPQCTVVNGLLYAPASGRLAAVGVDQSPPRGGATVAVDLEAEVGDAVDGPEAVFATLLAEVHVTAKDLKRARAELAGVLREPPRVDPVG